MKPRGLILLFLLAVLLWAIRWACYEHARAQGQRAAAEAAEDRARAFRVESARFSRAAAQWEHALEIAAGWKPNPSTAATAVDPVHAKELSVAIRQRYLRMNAAQKGLLALGFARRRGLGEEMADKLTALSVEHALAIADIGSAAFALGGGETAAALLRQRENGSYQAQLAAMLSTEDLHAYNASTSNSSQSIRAELGYFSAVLSDSGGATALSEGQLHALAAALSTSKSMWSGSPYRTEAGFLPGNFYPGDPTEDIAGKEAFLETAKTVLTADQYPIVENEIKEQELHISVNSVAFAKWMATQPTSSSTP